MWISHRAFRKGGCSRVWRAERALVCPLFYCPFLPLLFPPLLYILHINKRMNVCMAWPNTLRFLSDNLVVFFFFSAADNSVNGKLSLWDFKFGDLNLMQTLFLKNKIGKMDSLKWGCACGLMTSEDLVHYQWLDTPLRVLSEMSKTTWGRR
jgi:hypothetical protein